MLYILENIVLLLCTLCRYDHPTNYDYLILQVSQWLVPPLYQVEKEVCQ